MKEEEAGVVHTRVEGRGRGWGSWPLEPTEDKELKSWTPGFWRVNSPETQTPWIPETTHWVCLSLCRACSRRAERMITPGTSLAEMVSEAGLQRGARRMLIRFVPLQVPAQALTPCREVSGVPQAGERDVE